MSTETRPLQRSPQLASLSREHHDGLLFCWKLKQGVGNGTNLEELVEFTRWHWRCHLAHHFQQEEKILIPYIKNADLEGQLRKEHTDIRDLILNLGQGSERTSFSILAKFIENHIRFEERQLFMYLQGTLSLEELDVIAAALEQNTVSCEEWKNQFWLGRK